MQIENISGDFEDLMEGLRLLKTHMPQEDIQVELEVSTLGGFERQTIESARIENGVIVLSTEAQ